MTRCHEGIQTIHPIVAMPTTYVLKVVRGCLRARRVAAALLLGMPSVLAAQAVPVVDLAPAAVKSATSFGSVLNVFEFPDGSLAVNDASSRQLYLLDRTLSSHKVMLDSAMSTSSYGRNSVSIIACNCRELWFPDIASRSILTFEGTGTQKRVMSAPSAADFGLLLNARTIADTLSHLFYRGRPPRTPFPGRTLPPGTPVVNPDSTPLLRADFETRKVDTIANLRSLRGWVQYSSGESATHIAVDILASIDEWTALPDGTVAIVRGHDYHVDWLLPDGRKVSSPKLPFDFKVLTNADKAALMDSARKAELEKHRASYDRAKAAGGIEAVAMSSAGGAMVAAGPPMRFPVGEYHVPVVDSVPFERMPDYYPPIRAGAVTSDLDGNVWILPTTSAQSRAGELVYDVVNRERGLIMRVRLPVGRSIVGFGKNGTVYLVSRETNGKWIVERTTVSIPRKI